MDKQLMDPGESVRDFVDRVLTEHPDFEACRGGLHPWVAAERLGEMVRSTLGPAAAHKMGLPSVRWSEGIDPSTRRKCWVKRMVCPFCKAVERTEYLAYKSRRRYRKPTTRYVRKEYLFVGVGHGVVSEVREAVNQRQLARQLDADAAPEPVADRPKRGAARRGNSRSREAAAARRAANGSQRVSSRVKFSGR